MANDLYVVFGPELGRLGELFLLFLGLAGVEGVLYDYLAGA